MQAVLAERRFQQEQTQYKAFLVLMVVTQHSEPLFARLAGHREKHTMAQTMLEPRKVLLSTVEAMAMDRLELLELVTLMEPLTQILKRLLHFLNTLTLDEAETLQELLFAQ